MSATTATLKDALRHVDAASYVARQKHLGLRYQHQRVDGEMTNAWTLRVTTTHRADHWLRIATAGDAFGLCVQPNAEIGLIGQRLWHDYEGEARLLAWSMQHEGLLDALRRLLDLELTPIEFATEATDIDERVAGPVIEFELTGSDGKWHGALAMNSGMCDALLGKAELVPTEHVPTRWLGVPIPVALRTRGPMMDADTMRNCHTGDVIVLGQTDALYGSMAAVHADGSPLPARCVRDERGVTLTTGPHADWLNDNSNKEQPSMSDKGATANAQPLSASIPVRLSIQTAAVDVTISDLEQLGTGVLLPLDVPVAGSNVTILANGAPIGEGELVAAGDKLGVCIGRWRPDGL